MPFFKGDETLWPYMAKANTTQQYHTPAHATVSATPLSTSNIMLSYYFEF